MKKSISWALVLALAFPLVDPVVSATSLEISEQIIAKKTGGSGRSASRSRAGGSGSNRVNRGSSSNRASTNRADRSSFNRERSGSNRVSRPTTRDINRDRPATRDVARDRTRDINRDRPATRDVARDRTRDINRDRPATRDINIDRDRVGNRVNNIDRDRINIDSDRRYSNRINRNIVNIGDRNIYVNPRGWNSWGWNGGSAWYPRYSYWGGGFWGSFAAGAVVGGITGALITAAIDNDNDNQGDQIIIVQQGSPGYILLDNYGLRQTECSEEVVIINGPQDSVICATPTNDVPAGYYDVNPETMVLIER